MIEHKSFDVEWKGLADEEKAILGWIRHAHEQFIALPETHPSDLKDWVDAVHRLQNLVAFRVARRADPDYWKASS